MEKKSEETRVKVCIQKGHCHVLSRPETALALRAHGRCEEEGEEQYLATLVVEQCLSPGVCW